MAPRRLGWLALIGILAASQGCFVRGCTSRQPPIHVNPNMDDQPRYEAQAESTFFADGRTMRTPVEGTIARGSLAARRDAAFLTGKGPGDAFLAAGPVTVDETVLARGEERYGIYCAPCHHRQGDGKGVLFTRANIPTTSLHLDRVRTAPDGHIFDVITNGLGLMPGYRWPLSPEDRWAIVAYVRKLQSEHAAEAEAAP
jgi:mono/diheme cytochrome c family protein